MNFKYKNKSYMPLYLICNKLKVHLIWLVFSGWIFLFERFLQDFWCFCIFPNTYCLFLGFKVASFASSVALSLRQLHFFYLINQWEEASFILNKWIMYFSKIILLDGQLKNINIKLEYKGKRNTEDVFYQINGEQWKGNNQKIFWKVL